MTTAATLETHAAVQTRETTSTCSGWFCDGLITAVKGIAANFFPIDPADSFPVQTLKWAAKAGTVIVIGAAIYCHPVPSLIAAVGLSAIGMLIQNFSHTF